MAANRSPSSSLPGAIDRGSQAAIVASLVSSDPEMHAIAREYVQAGLIEMLNQLKRGDAATRAAIARSMSGVVANLFTQQTGDEGLNDLRIEMHEMMSEMRGDMDIGVDGDDEGEREDDTTARLVEQHRVMVPKS